MQYDCHTHQTIQRPLVPSLEASTVIHTVHALFRCVSFNLLTCLDYIFDFTLRNFSTDVGVCFAAFLSCALQRNPLPYDPIHHSHLCCL